MSGGRCDERTTTAGGEARGGRQRARNAGEAAWARAAGASAGDSGNNAAVGSGDRERCNAPDPMRQGRILGVTSAQGWRGCGGVTGQRAAGSSGSSPRVWSCVDHRVDASCSPYAAAASSRLPAPAAPGDPSAPSSPWSATPRHCCTCRFSLRLWTGHVERGVVAVVLDARGALAAEEAIHGAVAPQQRRSRRILDACCKCWTGRSSNRRPCDGSVGFRSNPAMNFRVSILKLFFNYITRQPLAFSYQVCLLLIVFGKLPLIVLVVGTTNNRSLPAALPKQN
ncbi:uncharacterized protein [Aegilops tauschii subsp. strangulata]|uniref:uncharacterized protein n=1 Tax=Aegilops tauschii subsp. strangulata TaxID=200361 RepID=UPI003CC85D1F